MSPTKKEKPSPAMPAANQPKKRPKCVSCGSASSKHKPDCPWYGETASTNGETASTNGEASTHATVDGQDAVIDGTVPKGVTPKPEPILPKPDIGKMIQRLTIRNAALASATVAAKSANEAKKDAQDAVFAEVDELCRAGNGDTAQLVLGETTT